MSPGGWPVVTCVTSSFHPPGICLSTLRYSEIFKKHCIYLFLERGKEREREGEKHRCATSRAPPTSDLARIPGLCPNQESNRRPFRPLVLGPLSHTSQGRIFKVFNVFFQCFFLFHFLIRLVDAFGICSGERSLRGHLQVAAVGKPPGPRLYRVSGPSPPSPGVVSTGGHCA